MVGFRVETEPLACITFDPDFLDSPIRAVLAKKSASTRAARTRADERTEPASRFLSNRSRRTEAMKPAPETQAASGTPKDGSNATCCRQFHQSLAVSRLAAVRSACCQNVTIFLHPPVNLCSLHRAWPATAIRSANMTTAVLAATHSHGLARAQTAIQRSAIIDCQ